MIAPLVSIIIPVHNGALTICRALDSIVNQHVSKEVIIVDDFSSDGTESIVELWEKEKQPSFKIVYRELDALRPKLYRATGAPNIARNEGVKLAKGKWIAFLDADDYWVSGKLQAQLDVLFENPYCHFCSTGFYREDANTGKKTKLLSNDGKTLFTVFEVITGKFQVFPSIPSSLLIEKEYYIEHDEYAFLTDINWFLRMYEAGPIVYVNQPLLVRVSHNDNVSYQSIIQQINYHDRFLIYWHWIQKYPHLTEFLMKEMRRWHGSFGRFFYAKGEYGQARMHFIQAHITTKNTLYFLTSFIPPLSRFISRKFYTWRKS